MEKKKKKNRSRVTAHEIPHLSLSSFDDESLGDRFILFLPPSPADDSAGRSNGPSNGRPAVLSVSGRLQECIELILFWTHEGFRNGSDVIAVPTNR